METLLTFVNSIHPMSSGLKEYLYRTLKKQSFSKKDLILKKGKIATNIYFIEKGLVRCFYEKNGKEVSSWFMKEGDFIISVESFYNQKPGNETIQALEDCSVYSINHQELMYMYLHYPEFNFIGRVLTEKYYILCEQRLYSMRMQKAKERYEYLQKSHPDLMQRVTAQHLASYLGVTMETLSRVKNRR